MTDRFAGWSAGPDGLVIDSTGNVDDPDWLHPQDEGYPHEEVMNAVLEEIERIAAVLRQEQSTGVLAYAAADGGMEAAIALYDAGLRVRQDTPGLREVARRAEYLVGTIEQGFERAAVLRAASGVNQALAGLGYPVDDEGLIDWAALARQDTEARPHHDPNHLMNGPEYHTGTPCIEKGCDEPAGTAWSPLWCQRHNAERLDRISGRLTEIRPATEDER
jgi:hypothetical protein